MKSKKVGFIGLGNMGKPMCKHLLEKGLDLTVYDIIDEAMDVLAKSGARKSTSPEDLASQCNMVILMLPGPKEDEMVCLGPKGVIYGAKKGTIVIDMTSSFPPLTRRIHDSFIQREIKMIDAPVSGMVKGAIERTLSIMVGGDVALLEVARPILEILGKNINHMGPIGSGHLMKAINNFLAASNLVGTAEAIAMAIKGGLDPMKVLTVLQNSTGNNYATNKLFPEIVLPGKPSGHPCSMLLKDIGHFVKVSQELEVPAFMASLVYSLYSIPQGNEDGTEFFNIYENWYQVKMKGIINSP